jgi:hypothetical protein
MQEEAASAHEPVHIDLTQTLSRSWATFARRPGTHLAAFVIVLGGGLLTLGLAGAPLLVGYLRMIERLRRDEPAEVGDVLEGLSSFAPAFVAGAVTTAAVVAGSVLIVLPGVVVAVVWSYGLWFVALEGQGGVQALASSWRLARRQASSLVLLLLAAAGLNLLGALVVVGVLVTGPLALIFLTHGFRELTET